MFLYSYLFDSDVLFEREIESDKFLVIKFLVSYLDINDVRFIEINLLVSEEIEFSKFKFLRELRVVKF